MDLITTRLKLKDIYPEKAEELAKRYKKDAGDFELIRKGKVSEKIEVDASGRSVVNYITTIAKDRDGEVVLPDGATLKDYRDNPVVLWAHRYDQLPIAKNLWIKQDKKGLIAKTHFLDHEFADQVYGLYTKPILDGKKDTGPAMKAWSIGFVPVEWNEPSEEEKAKGDAPKRTYTKWELLEYSAVPVPSNPSALTMAVKSMNLSEQLQKDLGITKPETTENYHRIPVKGEAGKHGEHKIRTMTVSAKKGIKALYCVDCKKIITYLFDTDKWSMEEAQEWVDEHKDVNLENIKLKSVIPYKDLGTAEEGAAWDGPAQMREADVDVLKLICAWYDAESGDNKGAYKLPHHRASDKKCVWRGVTAAMGAVLGARGGVAIPDADKKGVYNHLAKHYKQFDKEPPEFKKSMEDVVTKHPDSDGNPSVWDVQDALWKKIRGLNDPLSNKIEIWLVETYPVDFPDGHVIICYQKDDGKVYYQYEYTYNDGVVEFGDSTEVEISYEPVKRNVDEYFIKPFLSTKNRKLVKQCADMLNELYEATEPSPKDDGKKVAEDEDLQFDELPVDKTGELDFEPGNGEPDIKWITEALGKLREKRKEPSPTPAEIAEARMRGKVLEFD